ncbi:MAG: FHA domain-containing protein [Chitinivibrionales bacterium]|nr:FHA domain-containing protein [Chitinivibrionales bacterium]
MEWKIEVEDLRIHETQRYTNRKERITIGRNAANDIVIANSYISREHLILSLCKGDCLIEDLGSVNGTFLEINNKWHKIGGTTHTIPPFKLLLGEEISLRIELKAITHLANESADATRAHPKLSMSQVYSIKNLEREESMLVLDLCDSTSLTNMNETMAFHLKKRVDTISRMALNAHHARFHKNTGDGFIASFKNSIDAFRASREILWRITDRNQRTRNPKIHVRIALHKGKTYTIDSGAKDIHGNAVNIAFRIESLQKNDFIKLLNSFPERDRVLCTRYFYEDIKLRTPSFGDDFIWCGTAKLKGIKNPIEVCCVK